MTFHHFDQLPLELIEKIVPQDVYSVRDLLISTPWLRDYAVLIQDEQRSTTGPLFFDITEMKRLNVCDVFPLNEDNQDKKRFIKLFELRLEDLKERGALLSRDTGTSPLDTPHSFTYIIGDLHDFVKFRLEFSRCHYCEDPILTRTLFTMDEELFNNKYNLLDATPEEVNVQNISDGLPFYHHALPLRSLELTTSESIKNQHFPRVQSLTIRFSHTEKIPELSGIVAPELVVLKVHYSGKLPLIHDMGGVGNKRSVFARRGAFELINTDALEYTSQCIKGKVMDPNDYSNSDMSFVQRFSTLTLSGVPEFLVRDVCSQGIVHSLQWIQTVSYINDTTSREAYRLPLCDKFMFFTNVPYITVPKMDESFAPSDVCVFTTAIGFKIGGLLLNARQIRESLCHLTVSCLLSKQELGGSGHTVLKASFLELISTYGKLNRLCLEGCYFGKLNADLGYGPSGYDRDAEFENQRDQFMMEHISFKLLLPKELSSTSTGQLELGFFAEFGFWSYVGRMYISVMNPPTEIRMRPSITMVFPPDFEFDDIYRVENLFFYGIRARGFREVSYKPYLMDPPLITSLPDGLEIDECVIELIN